MVNGKTPVAVGVPDKTPAFSVNPFGKLPALTEKV